MPPYQLSYTTRNLDVSIRARMTSSGQVVSQENSGHAGSSNLALPIVVPIVVGVVLVVTVFLMPKGFLLDLVCKTGITLKDNRAKARRWFGQQVSRGETVTNEKPQSTFVQRHLETLRAWQKPTHLAQPRLPLYLAKPGAVHLPRRPASMTYQEWKDRQRNVTVRLSPMYEFKLTGAGVKGPAY